MEAEKIEFVVMSALREACEGDWTKLMGRCTEASILAWAALQEAGLTTTMVCGGYHGAMCASAREFFGGKERPFVNHSWLETDRLLIDPTQWVFAWETQEPGVYVGPALSPYKPAFTVRQQDADYYRLGHYANVLSWAGLNVPPYLENKYK